MERHPVECPCQELRLQSISRENLAKRLDRIRQLLMAWGKEDRDDYQTLQQIQGIVNGSDDGSG